MRTYKFELVITCASNGNADLNRVEQLLDLAVQDLVQDDHFVHALDEQESITVAVNPTR